MIRLHIPTATFLCACSLVPVSAPASELDLQLRNFISSQGIAPIAPRVAEKPALVELGKSLFFDPELSGNRDISCATCHHPGLGTGDGRSLPAGTGGHGLGSTRTQPEEREVVPRNAPEVFQRGHADLTSMFWDSRVRQTDSGFVSPAGDALPDGLHNVLAVQAMFPVTSRAEMRGDVGDRDANGHENEIARIADDNLPGIWQALTARLMNVPAYRQAFAEAYPDKSADEVRFADAANAIAAFETAAFSQTDSAWDRYVAGDDDALSAAAKRGASHFLGGSCASCHSGTLLTDQQHHNLGVPQLGPGKDAASGLDLGREAETGEVADRFAFRTPPLRNVTVTGPWMHNGAFQSLAAVVDHKHDPEGSLAAYDVSQLPEHLQSTVRLDDATIAALTASLSPRLPIGEELTSAQRDDLLAFLFSLTSPTIDTLITGAPTTVLSGLPVDELPTTSVSLLYDASSGDLRLAGAGDAELDALLLRVTPNDQTSQLPFEFAVGGAPWSESDVVLSDSVDAQSFLDFRAQPTWLLEDDHTLSGMVPANLDADAIAHLSAVYRVYGTHELLPARVRLVPEPSGAQTLGFLLGFWLLVVRRRLTGSAPNK